MKLKQCHFLQYGEKAASFRELQHYGYFIKLAHTSEDNQVFPMKKLIHQSTYNHDAKTFRKSEQKEIKRKCSQLLPSPTVVAGQEDGIERSVTQAVISGCKFKAGICILKDHAFCRSEKAVERRTTQQ